MDDSLIWEMIREREGIKEEAKRVLLGELLITADLVDLDDYDLICFSDDLKLGKYLRWFKKKEILPKLRNGGFLVDLLEVGDDDHDKLLRMKSFDCTKIWSLSYKENIFFQKKTKIEKILMKGLPKLCSELNIKTI
jgi:hypothetical protein